MIDYDRLTYVGIVGAWFFVVWLFWTSMAPLIIGMPL